MSGVHYLRRKQVRVETLRLLRELRGALRTGHMRYYGDSPDGRDPGFFDIGCGICWNVNYHLEEVWYDEDLAHDDMVMAFRAWPEFSGESNYPVPAPADSTWNEIGHYGVTSDMWAGDYGAARIRLLDHMIQFYEALVSCE